MEVLRSHLNLTQDDLPDDDISVAISSLLVGAANEAEPQHTLVQVYRAIQAAELTGEIDPLSTVPLLLPSAKEAAQIVLDGVAEQTSAKELVIACEEATERLKTNLLYDPEEEDDDDDLAGEGKENVPQRLSPAQQVARLLRIYAKALPRLKRGKRSASEILKPLLTEQETLIRFLGQNAGGDDGRDLMAAVAQLVQALAPWVTSDEEDKRNASEILYSLAMSTLEVCGESMSTGIAQAAFEKQFPRYRMPTMDAGPSEIAEHDIASDILNALSSIGYTTRDFETRQSIGSLVLLAHTDPYSPSLSTVQSFVPVILTSVETNTALEETLAFLLTAIGPLAASRPRPDLSAELILPLVHVFPPLAGAHPDAPLRHIIFRLVALTLTLSPDILRFQLLKELLTDKDTSPQFRVAVVGLVKEAVLEGLARGAMIATPIFLQEFAPILWRPQLPAADGEDIAELEEFTESPEPLRLVESLGLFYVVLQCDVDNKTGIREPSSMRNVERELLAPLRSKMESWKRASDLAESHDDDEEHDRSSHAVMQLGILEMWVDRAQSAITNLLSAPPTPRLG